MIYSGDHQGISHYRLVPRNRRARVSIFQETPRRVTVRVKTRIGRGSARAAIRVYLIIGWLRGIDAGESSSFRRLPEESTGHQGISHYKLALRDRRGRVSIFQKTPRRVIVRVKTRIGRGSTRTTIKVYLIIGWLREIDAGESQSFKRLVEESLSG